MLVRYFLESGREGRLSLVLSRDFRSSHDDLLSELESAHSDRISILELHVSDELTGGTQSVRRLLAVSREHGAAANEALALLHPDHLLFMYFDHAQLALPSVAAHAAGSDVSFFGILFRPTFHHEVHGVRTWLTALRKKHLLRRALKTPAFRKLLCLDPEAVSVVNGWNLADEPIATRIPDGISTPKPHTTREQQRIEWGCGADTTVFLFFGMVTERKGIVTLLKAARKMDRSCRKRTLIVIAGSVPDESKETVHALLADVDADVRLILDDRFIPDAEMASMFAACDVVLTPYVGHVGSSNVLVRAAAAGKPVIGPDEGLVGTFIRHHRLGITVDTRDSDRLARAIESRLEELRESFDAHSAQEFADYNSPERFAEEVFAAIDPG